MTTTLLPYAVPLLCLAVALGQIGCARLGPLTPWKGGGFGMFATVDRPELRTLSIVAADERGEQYRITLPTGTRTHLSPVSAAFLNETRMFPTSRRLERIAEAVLRADFALASVQAVGQLPARLIHSPYRSVLEGAAGRERTMEVIGPKRAAGSVSDVREIRVNVLRLVFDVANDRVTLRSVGPTVVASATEVMSIGRK